MNIKYLVSAPYIPTALVPSGCIQPYGRQTLLLNELSDLFYS
jgi:hypothetical protein